jgi:peroxiredoxin
MAKLFDRVIGKVASLAEGMKTVNLLEVGTQAPDFEVTAHDGSTVKLSDYRGKKVILWFYPKADTPG